MAVLQRHKSSIYGLVTDLANINTDIAINANAIGELSSLTTSANGSLVDAINELVAGAGSAGGDIATLQAELDATQIGVGLAADGSYVQPFETNYIDSTTSLVDADVKLDAAIKVNEDSIDELNVDLSNAVSTINTRIDSEVSTLNDTITALDADLSNAVSTINTRIDSEVSTLNDTINAEVATIAETMDNVQAELDATQTGAGLAVDGSYVAKDDLTNYIVSATSLDNADVLLDAAIKVNEDAISLLNSDNTVVGSVDYKIQNVIGAAPAALDTLQEIAASLNNDASLANTLTTLVSTNIDAAKAELRGSVSTALDTMEEIEIEIGSINNAISTLEAASTTGIDDVQAELNVTQDAAGLDADGSYIPNASANYISTAVSLVNADNLLDSAIDQLDADLSNAVSTINTRIDSEVSTLNDTITALDADLSNAVSTINTRIDSEVSTLNETINAEVDTLNNTISDLDAKIGDFDVSGTTYASTATDINNALAQLDAGIAEVASNAVVFVTEEVTVSGDTITLTDAPKDGVIFNFATVRHVDANFVSYDIPVTGTGSTFTLAADSSGQFDGKTVTVQYAKVPA